jgi:penicillin-insensitive murein endopeptidase
MPRVQALVALSSCAAIATLLSGCLGAPSPLAPNLEGAVGEPHHGVLTGGVALPASGDGFRRFRNDGAGWGHPRLVGAIERAAATVAESRPGAMLLVADMSAEHGGRLGGHRSHRTGRDADLLFYVITPDGRPVDNPGFVRVDKDGLAKVPAALRPGVGSDYVRLDVERTWLLVRALVSDERAQVQWLFVARYIEALLIEHAFARGESDDTIWRAENVLRQPRDSAPHDDHFHLRIACTPEEQLAGCEGGPAWPWLHIAKAPKPRARPKGPSDEQLLAALLGDAPADTGEAVSALEAEP